MYESFFKLNARPFADGRSNVVVPKSTVATGLDELRDWLRRDVPCALVTGASGCGKSHLCRVLVRECRSAVLLASAFTSTGALWQAALFELDEEFAGLSESEAKLQLLKAANERHGLLIVLDEAHGLAESTLEEVRTLTDYRAENRLLVRVLLSGQVKLEERLACPELEALNQRIGCHVVLEPLTQDQSVDYLELRLREVGGYLENIFSADAVRLICHASEGNLRCLNQLSDQSLVNAFAANERLVSANTVRAALDAAKELPLRWNPIAIDDDAPDGSADQNVPESTAESPELIADEYPVAREEFDIGAYAVIEVGGEQEEIEEPAPRRAATSDSEPAACDGETDSDLIEAAASHSAEIDQSVIELPVEDPYAQLDRVSEQDTGTGDAQPLPIQDAAIEVRRPEEEILSRLYELRHELQSAVRNSSRDITDATPDGSSRFADVPAQEWDVIEPAGGETQPSIASPSEDTAVSDVVETTTTDEAISDAIDTAAANSQAGEPEAHSKTPSSSGYGRLFSRLKRQHMKMAGMQSSGRSRKA